MRRLSFVICIAALCAVPAAADAKGLLGVTVCGADGCHSSSGRSLLRGANEDFVPISAPKRQSGYYTVRMHVGDGRREMDSWTLRFVPAGGLVQIKDEYGEFNWMTAGEATTRAFTVLSKGLAPFPAAKLDISPRHKPTAQVNEVFTPGGTGSGPSPPADDDGFPWFVLAAVLAGLAALAAIARFRPSSGRRSQTASAP